MLHSLATREHTYPDKALKKGKAEQCSDKVVGTRARQCIFPKKENPNNKLFGEQLSSELLIAVASNLLAMAPLAFTVRD